MAKFKSNTDTQLSKGVASSALHLDGVTVLDAVRPGPVTTKI